MRLVITSGYLLLFWFLFSETQCTPLPVCPTFPCSKGTFCNNDIKEQAEGLCVPCFNCTRSNRIASINCAREKHDCGECLPGFNKQLETSNNEFSCYADLEDEYFTSDRPLLTLSGAEQNLSDATTLETEKSKADAIKITTAVLVVIFVAAAIFLLWLIRWIYKKKKNRHGNDQEIELENLGDRAKKNTDLEPPGTDTDHLIGG